jgi:hypothetical protein
MANERSSDSMHVIKSVKVLSVARIMGALYGALGLLFLPFILLMGLASSLMPNQHGQNAFGLFFSLFFGVLAPVIYGVMGFLVGALGAFLYNLFAKWIGGIEVQVQPVGTT